MESTTPDKKLVPEEDESRFLIHSRVEIGFILRGAMMAGDRDGPLQCRQGIVRDGLLAVDLQNGICVVDAAKDDGLNRRLASSDRIAFVSRHDKIKIRWEVDRSKLAEFEGRPALYIPLPPRLLKFQRREFFRAETPVLRPVKCTIPVENQKPVVVPLFDISLGGVGLTGFPESVPVEVGTEFAGCTITLPELGVLSVTLQVRNVVDIPLRDQRVTRRVGCMFVNVPPGTDTVIQRYIIRLERERKSKLG
ncbi:MAG: flagellar brake protein [Betaproteobacteria bacterium]|nr:flagellar brake protein [Betaproteobacteria bacterium]